jgi:tetratricopeptide (TPR) repeat protein
MNVFERRAKINACLASAAGLAGGLAWSQPPAVGSDLWWHLAAGREIWSRGSVPSVDQFSFTFAGREWMNHEWLWDVLAWAAYALHPQAVAWGALLAVAALLAGLLGLAARASGSLFAAGATTWLFAASAYWFIDIRPHLVTLLFVTVLLLVRERPWAPWLWPPLVAIWANLHAGVVFGVCAIGLDVVLRTALATRRAGRPVWPRSAWIGLLLCLPALLATPWGPRILEYPLSYLEPDSPYRTLSEWLPPGFPLDPRRFEGRLWWMAALAGVGLTRTAYRDPYNVALATVGFAMALVSRRFIPLFALLAVPLIANALALGQARLLAREPRLASPKASLAAALAGLLLAAWLWSDVRVHPNLLERWTDSQRYPQAALRYLAALGPPRRILNEYSWGGFLMLHLPESQVYIDGRANTLYDRALFSDYEALQSEAEGRRARLAGHSPDAALVEAGRGFSRALRTGPDAWQLIYQDPVAEILVPPGSPLLRRALPSVEQVVGAHPEQRIMHARRLAQQGEIEKARAGFTRLIVEHPLHIQPYGDLAWLECQDDRVEQADRIIAGGVRQMPRRRRALNLLAAQAYEQAGDLPRALAAYRRSVTYGPFGSSTSTETQIERLERRLAGPRKGGKR